MQMSDAGLEAILKKYEGCKLKAYKCPAGIWTIGYGHTSAAGEPQVREGMLINNSQANEILRRDLRKFEEGVEKLM